MKIIINKFINPEKNIRINILQKLPVSLILFLIYISKVFDAVSVILPNTTSVSFMSNWRFLASRNLVQKLATSLEKIRIIILNWGLDNAVLYNIAKTMAILFIKI